MKKIALILLVLLAPAFAFGQNVGQCGWGSKLFDGQRGIIPQIFAVTTNGTSGNQTFAITSGTSGCTQDGVVRSSWKTAAFIDSNMNKLAKDISRGEGESLNSLANLVGVSANDNLAFRKALQENFENIFASENVSSDSVYTNIKNVLANSKGLESYSVSL